MDYSPKGHKEWDVTERLTLFTLAPYLVFYAFFCIKKGWELASCIFLNFLARWIPSESAHAQSWQEMGRKDKGERHHILSSASGSASSIAARMEERKTKIRKIPGLILRNTVLTTPGGGYDGGNHATPTTCLWAWILETTGKEQA